MYKQQITNRIEKKIIYKSIVTYMTSIDSKVKQSNSNQKPIMFSWFIMCFE